MSTDTALPDVGRTADVSTLSMSTLSDRLALHAASVSASDLPAPVLDAARRSVTDAVAVTIAASCLGEGVDAFAAIAHAEAPAGAATLLGHGHTSSPAMAAWVNGAAAHALDYEDTHDHAIAHPHAAAIPAALAIAEARGDVSGRDFLAAVAVAGDLVCRLAQSFDTNPDRFGWHTTPWLGVFGAATAAGVLLRLEPGEMKAAWSLAVSQMCSLGEVRASPDSHLRAVRDAFAAKAGVLGAELAHRGVAGFDAPLEGEAGFLNAVSRGHWSPDPILKDLGERWMGAEVSLKPWASCRGTHGPIATALELREEIGAHLERVTAVEVTVSEKNRMLCEPIEAKRSPETAIGAKFSVPFTVAAALTQGAPTLATFSAKGIRDPRILALAGRVSCRVDPAIPLRDTATCSVTVTLDGERITRSTDRAPGHPDRPLSEEELRRKFDECLAAARSPVPAATAARLHGALAELAAAPNLGFVRETLAPA